MLPNAVVNSWIILWFCDELFLVSFASEGIEVPNRSQTMKSVIGNRASAFCLLLSFYLLLLSSFSSFCNLIGCDP